MHEATYLLLKLQIDDVILTLISQKLTEVWSWFSAGNFIYIKATYWLVIQMAWSGMPKHVQRLLKPSSKNQYIRSLFLYFKSGGQSCYSCIGGGGPFSCDLSILLLKACVRYFLQTYDTSGLKT